MDLSSFLDENEAFPPIRSISLPTWLPSEGLVVDPRSSLYQSGTYFRNDPVMRWSLSGSTDWKEAA